MNPQPDRSIFETDNLCAWCIVPYDNLNRNALQRAQMLKELGIRKFAYDWRSWHLPYLAEEIRAMRLYNIEISAVWFWTDGGGPKLLNDNNETILKTLKEEGLITNLWVAFPEEFFMDLSDNEKLRKAITAINEIYMRAVEINCSVSLYNHGGWFGDIENQLNIIESCGHKDIGIAYNFFRGVHNTDNFRILLHKMLPYLKIINLNGIKSEGPGIWTDEEALGPPYILTIGSGDMEQEMMKIIYESGYTGLIGLIGHTSGQDVMEVLEGNIKGLKRVVDSNFTIP